MQIVKQVLLGAGLFVSLNLLQAQPTPPSNGGNTNGGSYTNVNFVSPYVPGLKLAISGLSGTNLPINLLEADPAGTYGLYAASNLTGATWSSILQGTNSQTNFTLPFPFAGMGFFRAARTDTPVTNTAGMSVVFPNNDDNTNVVSASITGGPAAAMAVLVNDTNLADAVWIPFSAVPYVLLGTNDGVYQVEFGFIGSDGQTNWTTASVILDTTPPALVITNPVASTTAKPMIQLQGYSPEPLASLTFNVTNSLGTNTPGVGLVTQQYFDTNLFQLTTNWFECLDVSLTPGTNVVCLQATDLAGNVTVTNLVYVFSTNGDTTPPAITLLWPQNGMKLSGSCFTLRGMLDNETANITAQTVGTNGMTNLASGLVERNGEFWLENLPLNPGTNVVTLTATDAAGNTATTNLTLIQSSVTLTMNPVASNQLNQAMVNVTGYVSDTSYAIWVNDVQANVNPSNNTWAATNVPVTAGGTASFDLTAYPPGFQPATGSWTNYSAAKTQLAYPNPFPSDPVQANTNQDLPSSVYVQSYYLNYQNQITGYATNRYGIRFTKVIETMAMNWQKRQGGTASYNYLEVYDSRYPTDTLTNIQSTVWPADGSPPTLGGTQTNVQIIGNGASFITVTNVGPPTFALENCNIQGTAGYNYAGVVTYPDTYARTAKTVVRYFTGGKSLSLRQNLHQLSVTVNQQQFVPGFQGGSENNGSTITSSVTAGVFGTVSNGVAYKVLADGQDVDITPQVRGTTNYNFNVSAQKYKLYILVNGTVPLQPNRVVPSAIFSVGQKLSFSLLWSPSTPPFVAGLNTYQWLLSGSLVNGWNSLGYGYNDYFFDTTLLNTAETTGWYYSDAQSKKATIDLNLQFSNGQSVKIAKDGFYTVVKPTASFSSTFNHYGGFWVNTNNLAAFNSTLLSVETILLSMGTSAGMSDGAMDFESQVVSQFPGTINWLQLVNCTNESGFPTLAVSTGGNLNLDGSIVYPESSENLVGFHSAQTNYYVNTSAFSDSPGILVGNNFTVMNSTFMTFLIFQPSTPDSIPVTLGRVDWSWNAQASYDSQGQAILPVNRITGPTFALTNQFPPLWYNIEDSVSIVKDEFWYLFFGL